MNVRKGCWFAVSVLALGAAALHAPAKAAASDAVFAPSSVWNSPLPPSPVLDAKSSTWSSVLAGGAHVADIYEFGVPIYEPSAGTPRYAVRILNSPAWGPDPLAGDTVPLTSVYTPSVGSDGAMAVVDRSTGKSYDMWRFSWNGGRPQTAWAGVASLTGPGNDSDATGAGISRLAGVVRAGEIAAGAINHTLVFSSDKSCRGGYRYPATKTDGASSSTDCLPEGARVQKDQTKQRDR